MATRITTAAQLAAKAIEVAKKYKTLYVMGCIGAPMTTANKARYIAHHKYNADAERIAMINAATDDTFGFDCVCFIKSLLWGWNGDKSKSYGGAIYGSNNVPDIDADRMITVCREISTDFSKIEIGEAVWMPGHIGIYVGDGLAVECTPIWKNGVQITACNCSKSGYNRRNWTKHGKLPYVTYAGKDENTASEQKNTGTSAGSGSVKTHTVKVGETLSAIAAKYGTTYQKLAEYNKLPDPDVIHVGQKIKIPAVAASGASEGFKVGDKVKCKPGVTKFANGAKMAAFVTVSTLYVRAVESGGKILLVSTEPIRKVYTGRVNAADMKKI